MEDADTRIFIVEAATLRKEVDALRAEIDKLKAEISTRDVFIDKLLDVLKARDAPRVTSPPPTFPPTPPTFYPYKQPPTTAGGAMTTPPKDLKTARADPPGYA
jgi:hypothetical protein